MIRLLSEQNYIRYMRALGVVLLCGGIALLIAATASELGGGMEPRAYLQVKPSWQMSLMQQSWQMGMMQQLQRFKRYPAEAQSRHEQGVVLLSFSLDRNGHVLAHGIARSSGYVDLDNEVMAMIMRAEPLPPFPASMTQARIDLTVPVHFSPPSAYLPVDPSWQTSLVQQLQRFKRYPASAQSRKEEGVVMLSFSLDRSGHVLAHSIARSSGYADLDDEVLAMIMRAEPLPPFPESMPQTRIDLTVPIRFSLH